MGSASDKAAGLGNEAMGKIKQGVAAVTDNDKMRAEGAGQELKGKAEEAIGKLTDDDQKVAEGKADQAAAKTKNLGEDVKDIFKK